MGKATHMWGFAEGLAPMTCPIVGWGGTVPASAVGGATWSTRLSGTNKDLYGATCTGAGACAAVGSGGTIVTSAQGSGRIICTGVHTRLLTGDSHTVARRQSCEADRQVRAWMS